MNYDRIVSYSQLFELLLLCFAVG